MKVLVTGATGFIGHALVLRLRRDGHAVAAWARDSRRAREQLGAEVEVRSHADGPDALARALADADGVVNLAGEPIFGGRWTAARRARMVESRVAATGELIAALEPLPRRPAVLVSASAVGYYGDRGDEVLTEASAPGHDFLAELCVGWEAAARGAEPLGVRVALPRIGIVLGRGGGALQSMLPAFRAGLGGPMGSGRQWLPWIHLDDLVAALVAALHDARCRGPINAVAPEPVTNADFSRALGRALHRPAFLRAPGFGLKLLLGEAAGALLGGQRVEAARLRALGFEWRFPSLAAALGEILAAPAPAQGA
jgi:hypothetical protein